MSDAKSGERRKRPAAPAKQLTESNAEVDQPGAQAQSDDNDSYDDDYAMKRQRNNAAVNKTRQKKRQEEQITQARVQELKDENTKLERKLESMRRELELLKEMVVACASGRRSEPDSSNGS
ncbi:basic region leucine zipper domain-containing protein [Ditylenchus destructor]|uniref:Basic region leucine zipper domain-containing protein n=1 Tax=Ditylenchus destructor TaxID=166010 RepID=A0AAD4RCI0_9BILA|nr:basic region leucine zipper domain-containing protein [Ditylenchus destructor]